MPTSSMLPPPPEEEPPASGPSPSGPSAPEAPALALPELIAAAASRARVEREARTELERRLVRDIVGAERFRTLLLASIATVALFLVVVQGRAPDNPIAARFLQGGFDRTTVEAFLLIVAAFELYVLAWSRKLLDTDVRPQASRRYLHAFVETSLPTAVIAFYATVDGPVQGLLMPSAFVYFIFILLSTLGLDPLLCLFTGVVAAGEYALVALVWAVDDKHVTPLSLGSQPHHLGKALVLLVGGIAAAFVARRIRRSFTQAIESFGERTRILGVFGQHVSPEVARAKAHEEISVRGRKQTIRLWEIA